MLAFSYSRFVHPQILLALDQVSEDLSGDHQNIIVDYIVYGEYSKSRYWRVLVQKIFAPQVMIVILSNWWFFRVIIAFNPEGSKSQVQI